MGTCSKFGRRENMQRKYLVQVEEAKEAAAGRPSAGAVYRSIFAKDGFPPPVPGLDCCWDIFRYHSFSLLICLMDEKSMDERSQEKKISSLYCFWNINSIFIWFCLICVNHEGENWMVFDLFVSKRSVLNLFLRPYSNLWCHLF